MCRSDIVSHPELIVLLVLGLCVILGRPSPHLSANHRQDGHQLLSGAGSEIAHMRRTLHVQQRIRWRALSRH